MRVNLWAALVNKILHIKKISWFWGGQSSGTDLYLPPNSAELNRVKQKQKPLICSCCFYFQYSTRPSTPQPCSAQIRTLSLERPVEEMRRGAVTPWERTIKMCLEEERKLSAGWLLVTFAPRPLSLCVLKWHLVSVRVVACAVTLW